MKTKSEMFAEGKTEPSQVIVEESAPHSIEFSRNAKGQCSWDIKLYFKDQDKGSIVEEIEKIDQRLLAKFPNVDDTKKLAELAGKAKK